MVHPFRWKALQETPDTHAASTAIVKHRSVRAPRAATVGRPESTAKNSSVEQSVQADVQSAFDELEDAFQLVGLQLQPLRQDPARVG